jgi:hypothetical protein
MQIDAGEGWPRLLSYTLGVCMDWIERIGPQCSCWLPNVKPVSCLLLHSFMLVVYDMESSSAPGLCGHNQTGFNPGNMTF